MIEFKLDMMQTVALGVAVFYLGKWLKTKIHILEKFCIPAPVVGGLIFSILHLALRQMGILQFELDTTLQSPFMMVFFTTIGMGASISLIKKGGPGVLIFWLVASALCIVQNAVGATIAKALGENPLIGLLCGSVTMTGGHGTAGAWGPTFEAEYGLVGAQTVGMAAATFGLVMGSLIGGPVGRRIITKKNLKSSGEKINYDIDSIVDEGGTKLEFNEFMKHLSLVFIAIGLGVVLQNLLKIPFPKFNLPAYVTAMIVAAVFLNVGETTGKLKLNSDITGLIGDVALNIFLSMALIGLRLWELAEVAGPMLIILAVQTLIVALFATFITYNLMGRDYDAAVMAAGHCGFGMGATPNGVANMQSVVEGFGPAPRAFFILPVVGAFLIDFTNTAIITVFVNIIS